MRARRRRYSWQSHALNAQTEGLVMRQISVSRNLRKPFALFLVAAGISMLLPGTAQQGKPLDQYDKVMLIESKPLKNYLSYPKSNFKDFVKLEVSVNDVKSKSSQKFEALFACTLKGQTGLLGCHRIAELGIEPKKYVAIQLKFSDKTCSEQEVMSAAYAVPPLLLQLHQLYKDDESVYAGDVYVPAAYYDVFRQSMANQGFQPLDAGNSTGTAGFPVHLIQDPGGDLKVLYYQQTVKKKT